MYIEVEKGVTVFVEDLNPGPNTKTIFFVHGLPICQADDFNKKLMEFINS
ncbi:hypothetical protein BFO01nite_47860 [Brevibacillus formosus]|uniref:Alpha/beta hydrolase n=1 Tax=Brevibacillus formosus TaxID=54913 RepID=A0ABQ0TBG9_9BACL|nr:hypothetical protein BFO01nite_47860 [Brevibacillus formosus]